jgi:hypothetical protein
VDGEARMGAASPGCPRKRATVAPPPVVLARIIVLAGIARQVVNRDHERFPAVRVRRRGLEKPRLAGTVALRSHRWFATSLPEGVSASLRKPWGHSPLS